MITIPRRRAGYVPLVLGCLLTVLMTWEVAGRPSPEDAVPFHAAAAEAIARIPRSLGPWEGEDVPIPASARALLKPNASMCRVYRHAATGVRASLMLVQCRDTRDMGGHYPPVCYPSQGWKENQEPEVVRIPLRHAAVSLARYEFRRASFDQERRLVVYNFFAIPGQGLPIDMEAVRDAAADYTARPFGAAQIQVVFDGRRTRQDETDAVEALLLPIEPVILLLADRRWRAR